MSRLVTYEWTNEYDAVITYGDGGYTLRTNVYGLLSPDGLVNFRRLDCWECYFAPCAFAMLIPPDRLDLEVWRGGAPSPRYLGALVRWFDHIESFDHADRDQIWQSFPQRAMQRQFREAVTRYEDWQAELKRKFAECGPNRYSEAIRASLEAMRR